MAIELKEKVAIYIEGLQPNMEDYADNSMFHYWMDYACELDELILIGYQDDSSKLVERINKTINDKLEMSPEHHACVDVAITLESQLNEFKGVFTYEC